MTDSLDNCDVLLGYTEDDPAPVGFQCAWDGTEEAASLNIEEQTVPDSVVASQEDENYGFHDLTDSWRASFTNFIGGEGQPRRDISGGSIAKYHRSNAVDVSKEGSLRLHHAMRLIVDPDAGAGNVTTRLAAVGILCEFDGKVAMACDPLTPTANANHLQLGIYDPIAGTWSSTGNTDDPATTASYVTALCTDGYWLYVAYSGGDVVNSQGIFKYTPAGVGAKISVDADADSALVTRMVTAAGVLYMSTATKLGYLKGAVGSATFERISPAALTSMSSYDTDPPLTSFGLVADGTSVYWGVTGGERSYVYEAQWNAAEGAVVFEQFAQFPTGFIGTTLIAYLGQIYIGGYTNAQVADVGQGIIYLATSDGIAKLTSIGDDPNECVGTPGDSYKNQIIAGYAYDHYVYFLTKRSLYRWDVRAGGLNHIADVGIFSAGSGDPGSLLTIPWDTDNSYWPGYAHVYPTKLLPGLSSSSSNRTVQEDVVTGTSYKLISSSSNDRYGDVTWLSYTAVGTGWSSADAPWDDGGTVEWSANKFWRECFSVQITSKGGGSGLRSSAIVSLYGRVGSDQVAVYYLDSTGNKTFLCDLDKRDDVHSFQLVCDDAHGTARLYHAGLLLAEWVMPRGVRTTIAMAYMYGGNALGTEYKSDWAVSLQSIRWAAGAGNYDPGWTLATGVIGASQFTVVGGSPFLASVPSSGTKGLVGFDFSDYAESGELWTSETTSKMPTVEKAATNLDVFHEPTKTGETITVVPYVDGAPQAPLVIPPNTERRFSTLAMMNAHGSAIACYVRLDSAAVTTTPEVHGMSVRFSPLDNSYYQLRLDLRDVRKDKVGIDQDVLTKLAWIIEAARSKRVLWLTTPLEQVRVRASILSYNAQAPSLDQRSEAQGFVTVRLKCLAADSL